LSTAADVHVCAVVAIHLFPSRDRGPNRTVDEDDRPSAVAVLEGTAAREARRASMTTPRHVVVCGAGVIGAAVAYFLSLRGVAVTVIERTSVACAASGTSGGFIALDWCDGSPLGPLARASFALHAKLARDLATDYGYRRMDTFAMTAREKTAI